MLSTAMNSTTDSRHATAMAARINAASQDAAAARVSVAQLERQVLAARARADRLAARLARIERFARGAMGRTQDQLARAALGSIAVTAADTDMPALVSV